MGECINCNKYNEYQDAYTCWECVNVRQISNGGTLAKPKPKSSVINWSSSLWDEYYSRWTFSLCDNCGELAGFHKKFFPYCPVNGYADPVIGKYSIDYMNCSFYNKLAETFVNQ